jgi:hypothetical protein
MVRKKTGTGYCQRRGFRNVQSADGDSSFIFHKILSLLGLGSANIVKIKTEEGNREAINIKDLEENILELNGPHLFLFPAEEQ